MGFPYGFSGLAFIAFMSVHEVSGFVFIGADDREGNPWVGRRMWQAVKAGRPG